MRVTRTARRAADVNCQLDSIWSQFYSARLNQMQTCDKVWFLSPIYIFSSSELQR